MGEYTSTVAIDDKYWCMELKGNHADPVQIEDCKNYSKRFSILTLLSAKCTQIRVHF